MITAWHIYWITILDSLNALFMVLATFSCIAFFIIWGFCNEIYKANVKKAGKHMVAVLICFILFSSIVTFLPNTKQGVAIYIIPTIVNNEQIQEIPQNVATLFNEKLKSWIDETLDNGE